MCDVRARDEALGVAARGLAASGAAGGSSGGLIDQPFFGEEALLPRRPDEFLSAVVAVQGFVTRIHLIRPPSPK